jgi:hypothetical protein
MNIQLEMFSLTPHDKLNNDVTDIKVQLEKLRKSHFAAKTELLQLVLEARTELDALKDKISKVA